MHVKIGADGGIVTKVDFQAQDFKLIRSALAFDALADKSSRYFFFYYQTYLLPNILQPVTAAHLMLYV